MAAWYMAQLLEKFTDGALAAAVITPGHIGLLWLRRKR